MGSKNHKRGEKLELAPEALAEILNMFAEDDRISWDEIKQLIYPLCEKTEFKD